MKGNINHIVTIIEDVKPALDNEVKLASSSKAGCPRKKRLVYIPSKNAISIQFVLLNYGVENRTPYTLFSRRFLELCIYNDIY